MSRAEIFAADLPSVRRAFALQVIEKHAREWVTESRSRCRSASAQVGKPKRQAKVKVPPPPQQQQQPERRAPTKPTRRALQAIDEAHDPCGCSADAYSTCAGYAQSHAQRPVTGKSLSQHARAMRNAAL